MSTDLLGLVSAMPLKVFLPGTVVRIVERKGAGQWHTVGPVTIYCVATSATLHKLEQKIYLTHRSGAIDFADAFVDVDEAVAETQRRNERDGFW